MYTNLPSKMNPRICSKQYNCLHQNHCFSNGETFWKNPQDKEEKNKIDAKPQPQPGNAGICRNKTAQKQFSRSDSHQR